MDSTCQKHLSILKWMDQTASKRKEKGKMKKISKAVQLALGALLIGLLFARPASAATNQATDPGGGGVTLTASGNVTVNSTGLQLVKQVWSTAGACLASSPTDPNCNAGATSVTVASSTALKFLIFVRNTTDISLSDVRIQDVIDITATGFTYAAGSMKDETAQLDTATIANIFTAANTGTALTDAVDGDVASVTGGSTMTIGAVTGQANATLNIAAHTTFGLLFQATKK
jgi:hypothetical protein